MSGFSKPHGGSSPSPHSLLDGLNHFYWLKYREERHARRESEENTVCEFDKRTGTGLNNGRKKTSRLLRDKGGDEKLTANLCLEERSKQV